MSGAVVLLSGGQDSTTTLYAAMAMHDRVTPVAIRYGQRHSIEISSAEMIVALVKKQQETSSLPGRAIDDLIILDAPALSRAAASDLTSDGEIREGRGELPTSFVPGRNLLFMTLAAAVAYDAKLHEVWTGVCQTDFSGYPDCRRETVDAMERALTLGIGQISTNTKTKPYPIRLVTPLMWLTKAETVRFAARMPGCMEALALSHTCYYGKRPPCGECPACAIRERGFAEAGIPDPLTVG